MTSITQNEDDVAKVWWYTFRTVDMDHNIDRTGTAICGTNVETHEREQRAGGERGVVLMILRTVVI